MTGADWSDQNALAIALYLDGSDDPDRAEDGTLAAGRRLPRPGQRLVAAPRHRHPGHPRRDDLADRNRHLPRQTRHRGPAPRRRPADRQPPLHHRAPQPPGRRRPPRVTSRERPTPGRGGCPIRGRQAAQADGGPPAARRRTSLWARFVTRKDFRPPGAMPGGQRRRRKCHSPLRHLLKVRRPRCAGCLRRAGSGTAGTPPRAGRAS